MPWLSDEELLGRLAAPTNEREHEALLALKQMRADLAVLRAELDALLDILARLVGDLENPARGLWRRTRTRGG